MIAPAQVKYVASTVARSKTPTFSTASVISGRARSEFIPSGLPSRADIADVFWARQLSAQQQTLLDDVIGAQQD
jgi:hypothetical protein